MRKRTQARELTLQFLYQIDLRGREVFEEFPRFIEEAQPDREVREYVRTLVNECISRWDKLDETITSVAENWVLSRIAPIDRNILRIAIYELLYCNDIPHKVAINEAIELAKKFSTQNSGAFINGILDKLLQNLKKGTETHNV